MIFLVVIFSISATAFAASYEYIDENGDKQTVEATKIAPNVCTFSADAWYYIEAVHICNSKVTIKNEVNIIINGKFFTRVAPIEVSQGGVLNIYTTTNTNSSAAFAPVALDIKGVFNIGSGAEFMSNGPTLKINGGTLKIGKGTIVDGKMPKLKIGFTEIENATFVLPEKTALELNDDSSSIVSGAGISIPIATSPTGQYSLKDKSKKIFTISFNFPDDKPISLELDGGAVDHKKSIEKEEGSSVTDIIISPENGHRFKNAPTIEPNDSKYQIIQDGQAYQVQLSDISDDITITINSDDLEDSTYTIKNAEWTYDKENSLTVESFFVDSVSTEIRQISIKSNNGARILESDEYELDDLATCPIAHNTAGCLAVTFSEGFIKNLANDEYELVIEFINDASANAKFNITSPQPDPDPELDPEPESEPDNPPKPIDTDPRTNEHPAEPSRSKNLLAPNTGHQDIKSTVGDTPETRQSSAKIALTSLILPLIISALFCAAASCRTE